MLLLNPRRSRRRNRRVSRSFRAPRRSGRRHHRKNAGFLSFNPGVSIGTATKGFSDQAISNAAPLAVGVLANRWLQDQAASRLGPRFGVDLSSGWKNTITGTVTAGALSMVPRYGGSLFAGAMMQVMIKALLPFIPGYEDLKPLPPPPPPAPPKPAGPTFSGIGHYIPDFDLPYAYQTDDETEMRNSVRLPQHPHTRAGMKRMPAPRRMGEYIGSAHDHDLTEQGNSFEEICIQ